MSIQRFCQRHLHTRLIGLQLLSDDDEDGCMYVYANVQVHAGMFIITGGYSVDGRGGGKTSKDPVNA